MTHCILCDKEILEKFDNDTDEAKFCLNTNEHIFPNAIGGRTTVRGFICDDCNNTGGKCDAELLESFELLCLIFQIKRQKGIIQSVLVKSDQEVIYYWSSDNSLIRKNTVDIIKSEKDGSIREYKLSSSNDKWLIKNIKNIEKRFKNIPLSDEEIQEKLDKNKQSVDIVHLRRLLSLGKPQYQSMIKTSLAYAYSIGIKKDYFDTALPFLKGDASDSYLFGSYDIGDCIVNRPIGIPFHCVAIDGDPQSKLLLGYVEYFGIYRYIILLSDKYEGQKIHQSYAIDPTFAQEIKLDVKFPFDQMDIQECLANKYFSSARLSKRFENMIKAFQLQSDLEEVKEIIRNKLFETYVNKVKQAIKSELSKKFHNIPPDIEQNMIDSVISSECKKEDISEDQINQQLAYYFFNEDED